MTAHQFFYHTHQAYRLLPHGERPTRKHVAVARALSRWQHAMPSHVRLARTAGCCVRTVGNALRRLRELGLLDWSPVYAALHSGRRLRLPNRYRFVASFLLFTGRLEKTKIPTKESLVGKLSEIDRQGLLTKWGLAGGGPQPPVRTPAQQIAWLEQEGNRR